MTNLRTQILDISRQTKIGELSPFLSKELDRQIEAGFFMDEVLLTRKVLRPIIDRLVAYRKGAGVENVVLGMSGGVDSALTAALFKQAGWNVTGVTMPIHQNPDETDRGQEAIEALGIAGKHIDLSALFDTTLDNLSGRGNGLDPDLDSMQLGPGATSNTAVKIRRGNIRARLRMITLYNLASKLNGIVASTDNFSELAAGFWTLHGDVGDVAPIQGLNKSWEVPTLAKLVGVPEKTWRATPTDGLGIDNGDEAQLGCSYLEWDLIVNAMLIYSDVPALIENDAYAQDVYNKVLARINKTWYKRKNAFNFDHPVLGNIDKFEAIDTLPNEVY